MPFKEDAHEWQGDGVLPAWLEFNTLLVISSWQLLQSCLRGFSSDSEPKLKEPLVSTSLSEVSPRLGEGVTSEQLRDV